MSDEYTDAEYAAFLRERMADNDKAVQETIWLTRKLSEAAFGKVEFGDIESLLNPESKTPVTPGALEAMRNLQTASAVGDCEVETIAALFRRVVAHFDGAKE